MGVTNNEGTAPMKNATPRTLEAMQNYHTRYEVAITANGETFIADYMIKKGQSALIAVARDNKDYLLNVLGDDADKPVRYTRAGLEFSPTVRVYFTGRTERDARIAMGA